MSNQSTCKKLSKLQGVTKRRWKQKCDGVPGGFFSILPSSSSSYHLPIIFNKAVMETAGTFLFRKTIDFSKKSTLAPPLSKEPTPMRNFRVERTTRSSREHNYPCHCRRVTKFHASHKDTHTLSPFPRTDLKYYTTTFWHDAFRQELPSYININMDDYECFVQAISNLPNKLKLHFSTYQLLTIISISIVFLQTYTNISTQDLQFFFLMI